MTIRATIAALASGRPPSAIAVVRVSGPHAFASVAALVGDLPLARRAGLRAVRRGDGALLDRALVLAFPGPGSATGEDVVELHLHGGPAVVSAVLDALTEQPGVRLAEAGEFTRRAFANGRLDLTQVEGLADLLAATTEAQRAQAAAQMEGALAGRLRDWRARLVELLAEVEAGLDFADEDDVATASGAFGRGGVTALIVEMRAALGSASKGERLREGLSIALVGPTNVGKSSLLNALAGREAAIVSPYAGTTRDPVEVTLDLRGIPVTLIDTAGLRTTSDPMEAEGIARARARAGRADLVLTLSANGEFASEGQRVRTKIDLAANVCVECKAETIGVSARTGEGLEALTSWLANWAATQAGTDEPSLVTRARQREALAEALDRLVDCGKVEEAALQAEALRLALRALGRLAGGVDVEDVLDVIFARFCIGK